MLQDKKWSQEERMQHAQGHTMCQWQRNLVPFQLAPKSSQENDRKAGMLLWEQGWHIAFVPKGAWTSWEFYLDSASAAFNFPMAVRPGGVCLPQLKRLRPRDLPQDLPSTPCD